MGRNDSRRRIGALVAVILLILAQGCGDKGTGGDGPGSAGYLPGVWSVTEHGSSCEITGHLEPYWTYDAQWIDTLMPGDLILDPDHFSGQDLVLHTPVTEVTFILCLGVNTPERVDMLCMGTVQTPNCRGPISVHYRGTPDSLSWLLQKTVNFTYGGAQCGLTDSAKVCFRANTIYTRVGDAPAHR